MLLPLLSNLYGNNICHGNNISQKWLFHLPLHIISTVSHVVFHHSHGQCEHSPYFKDIYQYLLQDKFPSSELAIKKLEALSEKYVLLDSLLFRIHPERETAVLVITETCVDKIITLYHKSLFAGHQGVIKTYLTISDKFFIPNLIHYLRSYIKGCHICQ